MADKKISALTGASTPLAGTEVLPIVQSGATVKVAVSDLTAGRAIAMATNSTIGSAVASTDVFLKVNGVTSRAGGIDFQESGVDKWLIGNGPASNNGNFEIFDAVTGNNYTFTHSGNFTVPGNVIIGTNGKGIDFSATPGTGTSELFADYEEGTWTPTVASFSGSITSYTSAGTYTKIGRQVTVSCIFSITNNGTGAGLLLITALPFTPYETINLYASVGNNRTSANTLYAEVANSRIQVYTALGLYPGITGNNYCVTATYFV